MRKSLMALCLMLAGFSGSTYADELCNRSFMDMGNEERLMCSAQAAERTERELQKAYRKALRSQKDSKLKSELTAAQNAWTRYRELQCTYFLHSLGAATEGLALYQGCKQDIAKERIVWLER